MVKIEATIILTSKVIIDSELLALMNGIEISNERNIKNQILLKKQTTGRHAKYLAIRSTQRMHCLGKSIVNKMYSLMIIGWVWDKLRNNLMHLLTDRAR